MQVSYDKQLDQLIFSLLLYIILTKIINIILKVFHHFYVANLFLTHRVLHTDLRAGGHTRHMLPYFTKCEIWEQMPLFVSVGACESLCPSLFEYFLHPYVVLLAHVFFQYFVSLLEDYL